jgi:hypothetical protein
MKMQKFRKKMIVFAVVFFLGFFVFGQVDAVFMRYWSDNGGMEVIGLEYDENDVLVMTFTFHEYEGDRWRATRGGIVFDQDNNGRILGINQNQQIYPNVGVSYMQFSDPIIYAGDCITGGPDWWGDNYWDYNATGQYSGFWVDSGDYCSICFESPNGGCLTKDEIGDPPFYENYSLPYYLHARIGGVYKSNDGRWDGGTDIYNSEPVYDLIPWGETPEPPEPDPINAECGLDAGKTFYGVDGPENFCEKGDFSWNDLDYNAETQTWTWICTGQHGGANTFCNAYWQAEAPPAVINAECGAFSYLESIDEADFFPNSPVGKCEKGIYRPDTFVSGSIGGSWVCSGVPYLIGESVRCSVRWSETLGDQIIPVPDIEYEDCDSYNIPEKWICQIRNFLAQAFLPSSEKLNSLNENIENIKNKAPFNYITAFTETLEAVQDDLSDEPIQMSLLGNQGTLNLEGWQIPALFRKMFLVIFLIGFIVWAVNYIKRIF